MVQGTSFKDTVELGQVPRRDWLTIVPVDTSVVLDIDDRVVLCSSVADAAYTMTLPSVAKAAGLIFTIHLTARTAGAYTLQDCDDSDDWDDLTLNTAEDGVCLFSDGRKWWIIANYIA